MDNEIESLWLSLGIKPDDSSASDAVDKIIKAVQSKLKSSIYGGKNGVITLPATIEGKFKDGREIDKSITDAYAAIYEKAKQMADESASLTLKDIKDFKAQIDKFGKQTAKYRNNDVIANANNNLRQTVATYQNYINELKGEVAKTKKAQVKQTQKVKAKQKAKTKKSSYNNLDISDEEIESDIQNERKRRLSGIKQVEPKGYKHYVGFEGGVATDKTLKASDRGGPYPSNYARQMRLSELAAVKWMKKSLKTYKSENIADDYAKALQNGDNKNNISGKQKADETANLISNELAKILGGLEANRPDVSIDQFNKYLEATLQSGKNGKGGYDAILLALNKTFNRYFNTDGTIGITDGGKTGVGEGHQQAQKAIVGMIKLFKEKLDTGFADKVVEVGDKLVNVSAEEIRQLKTLAKIDPREANKELDRILNGTNVSSTKQGSGSKLDQEVDRLVQESKNTTDAINQTNKLTTIQTTYDKNANVKSDVDMAKEIATGETNRDINKEDAKTGFNTDATANKLIKIIEDIGNGEKFVKKATSEIKLPADTKDLYKALPDPNRLLGLPEPDGRRKKISDGMKDENPQLSLVPVQDALKKSLAVIPGEFAKTLKESIYPSVKDVQHKINKPEGTDKFEYNEDVLRRLANASNAKKEARRKQDMNYTSPPKTIIPDYQPQIKHSDIYASPIKTTLRDVLENFVNEITGASDEYKKIISASTEQQDEMAAERVKIWGMNNGRNPNDTGDIANMRRVLDLYRNNKASIEQNPELMQKIKLTSPIEVDTTELTKTFNEALSGKNMRNAQMGGSPLQQVLGAMRGFTFMPSIEKSRALADGLNKIFGDINKAINSVLANIQMNESILAGMEKSGEVEFDSEGYMTKGSSAAKKTLADLEESKYVFETIKADLLENEKIVKTTGNDYGKMVKLLSFTSPILRDDNTILRYLNAGLNKNGEALHFQTRLAEILNYTFQLIGRSIGQWFKRLLSMINPLNVIKNIAGKIKSAFQDFGSYDTKWQRTMNVVKINFQRSIRPAMEWIAQKLVNMIGFFNIISMKVQEAFGQVPVDLFDQAGANAEKMRRELEKAANVTAGFDELHDIGSDNSGENDLLGDIYKPQLSKDWIDLANRIGDTFAHLIKGDMGFGDVCKEILRLLGELLGKIAKVIWDWFKETALGKWITDHWKGLLATLLALFVGWQLLKIFGPTLLSKIGGAFKTLFTKVGGWITTLLGANGFGQGIITAFQTLFAGGKYSLIGTLKEMFTSSAAITEAGSWGSMIGFAVTKGLLAALTGYATYKTIDHFGNKLADKTSYNLGVEYAGGKDKDKKGTGWAKAGAIGTGIIGGAATGALVGGAPGAAIGAVIGGIAGTIQSVLRPSLEEAEVAARSLNGELQNMHFNEAQVQTFQEQSDVLSEQLDLLKQSLDTSTQSVYDQGEKLGISKTRMDELIASTQNGTFNTGMLTGAEVELSGSLTDLAQKQEHYTAVTKEAEEAEKKLLKAKTDLAIEQDMEAGNFEVAAARIEVAEAQKVYSTEEATDRRIELFKKCADEERANLLQDLTPDQKKRMTDLNNLTDVELAKMHTSWEDSSEATRNAILNGLDENTQAEFKRRMDQIDDEIESHVGFWQSIGDTLAEIFSFGHATTWTYNGNEKYEDAVRNKKIKIQKNALGTNYVEADGLQYLHQGEAIIPKKYNQPYQPGGMSAEERAYMDRMIVTMNKLDGTISQGINIRGEFRQRGNDLVATVEKAKNRNGNQPLNNAVFAR